MYETVVPRDIILNILVKLPPRTILHCKLVCKEWRDIISDPFFVETHYKNSRVNFIRYWNKFDHENEITMIERYKIGGNQRFESLNLNLSSANLEKFGIVNSCRGILLLGRRYWRGHGWFPLYICNPLTNEYISLPEVQLPWFKKKPHCGLGFGSTTKQYKVVRVFPEDTIMIYTIGTRGWRSWRIKDATCRYDIGDPNDFPIDFNGVLHWLAERRNIVCFNIDKEELYLMPLPRAGCTQMNNIGVIHASLYYSIATGDGVELWVMKDYGVRESWIRFVVIHDIPRDFRGPSYNRFQLVEVCDNGEIVLLLPLSYDFF